MRAPAAEFRIDQADREFVHGAEHAQVQRLRNLQEAREFDHVDVGEDLDLEGDCADVGEMDHFFGKITIRKDEKNLDSRALNAWIHGPIRVVRRLISSTVPV